ncbi:MerC domain-containing protein [Nannocystis punicea]|uniref:MerC domain-containing protein n=1 Tax=Nannocystis punicea TaxID=2995304 RepID=A0ABY7GY23_9BACT|nr:MerC domain-containing protein [Nannocystis poenicansa]WAS91881.1 MerC domain-containing protein [Nannocystis poenicansa]
MEHPELKFRRGLDRLGVVASSLCLIHCLATPLLVVLFPLVVSERFEGLLAWSLIALATISVGLSLARRRLIPAVPYTLGILTLALTRAHGSAEGSSLELVSTMVAASLMISTHLLSLSAGGARAPEA